MTAYKQHDNISRVYYKVESYKMFENALALIIIIKIA